MGETRHQIFLCIRSLYTSVTHNTQVQSQVADFQNPLPMKMHLLSVQKNFYPCAHVSARPSAGM